MQPPGPCLKCGYDLGGTPSVTNTWTCPECGRANALSELLDYQSRPKGRGVIAGMVAAAVVAMSVPVLAVMTEDFVITILLLLVVSGITALVACNAVTRSPHGTPRVLTVIAAWIGLAVFGFAFGMVVFVTLIAGIHC